MPIKNNREDGGKLVREIFTTWAREQPNPKASWLTPWEELSEPEREVDRRIWEGIVAPYQETIAMLLNRLHYRDERSANS